MVQFNKDYLDMFLGIVRKYMQVRGGYSQKDLAELAGVGVSTMSRFLNQKTRETDEQLIARIVAKLQIPLHEIIDFVEEKDSERFVKLVKFYRDEPSTEEGPTGQEDVSAQRKTEGTVRIGNKNSRITYMNQGSQKTMAEKIEDLSPRQRAYLADFLNLDIEGRDLLVDLGTSLFRYFRIKGMEF